MFDPEESQQDIEVGDADENVVVTETTEETYLDKMKGDCYSAFLCIFLLFGSMGLLVWNEGRAVRRDKDLDEGRLAVKSIQLDNFSQSTVKSGLVHVTDELSTPSVLRDDIFGVTTGSPNSSFPEYRKSALWLRRKVEMFQWLEISTSKKVETSDGGTKTETTYSYHRVWLPSEHSSVAFKDKTHKNPIWPFGNEEWAADKIFLGNELRLSSDVIDGVLPDEPVGDIDILNMPREQYRFKVTKTGSNSLY